MAAVLYAVDAAADEDAVAFGEGRDPLQIPAAPLPEVAVDPPDESDIVDDGSVEEAVEELGLKPQQRLMVNAAASHRLEKWNDSGLADEHAVVGGYRLLELVQSAVLVAHNSHKWDIGALHAGKYRVMAGGQVDQVVGPPVGGQQGEEIVEILNRRVDPVVRFALVSECLGVTDAPEGFGYGSFF